MANSGASSASSRRRIPSRTPSAEEEERAGTPPRSATKASRRREELPARACSPVHAMLARPVPAPRAGCSEVVTMKRWTWWFAAALATTVAIPLAATAQADEKNEHETPVSIDKVPAAARETLPRGRRGPDCRRRPGDGEGPDRIRGPHPQRDRGTRDRSGRKRQGGQARDGDEREALTSRWYRHARAAPRRRGPLALDGPPAAAAALIELIRRIDARWVAGSVLQGSGASLIRIVGR